MAPAVVFQEMMFVVVAGVEIRVYVVPTSLCSIAVYLALTDPWYRRQVYSPFQCGINILPKLQLTDDDGSDLPGGEAEAPRGDIVTPTYVDSVSCSAVGLLLT